MHILLCTVAICYLSVAHSSFLGLGSLLGRRLGFVKRGMDSEAELSLDSGDKGDVNDKIFDSMCLFTSGRRKLRVRGIIEDESDCVTDGEESGHLRMDEISDFAPLQVMCEVNGYTVPAIIDTGAQISIMSYSCAQRCRINNNIDARYAGRAIGVGSSDILGRINGLSMKIGPISFDGKVSILRDSRVDFLIGLDFLKRFNCEVSFKDRALRLQVRHKYYKIPLISEFYNSNSNQMFEIPAPSCLNDDDHYDDDGRDHLSSSDLSGYSDPGESEDSSDSYIDEISHAHAVTDTTDTTSHGYGHRSISSSSSRSRLGGNGSGNGTGSWRRGGKTWSRTEKAARESEKVRSVEEIIASTKQEAETRRGRGAPCKDRREREREGERGPASHGDEVAGEGDDLDLSGV